MKQVFEIVPPSGSAFTVVVAVILLVQVGLLALVVYVAHSARYVRFEVSADGLQIRGGLYGRTIPLRDLVVEQARVVDLDTDAEYRLGWRANGIGLPGYQAGWHRMKKGGKALAFVTERKEVVFIPTRRGYSVLLSVASPDAFLYALGTAGR
jgi:hypothetical protein